MQIAAEIHRSRVPPEPLAPDPSPNPYTHNPSEDGLAQVHKTPAKDKGLPTTYLVIPAPPPTRKHTLASM